MARTLFHTILLTLLTLLYAADCGMPCLDGCGLDPRDVPSAVMMGSHHDHDDHTQAPAESGCECHCLCACHLPVVDFHTGSQVPSPLAAPRCGAYHASFPTTSVNPPDHIPLA
jgi:hypothetical protein